MKYFENRVIESKICSIFVAFCFKTFNLIVNIMNPSTEKIGNAQLLKFNKTAFLCSRKVPESQEKIIYDWVKHLNPMSDCILCGNFSEMEQKVFTLLLEYKIPTILVMPDAVAKRWDKDVEEALNEKRLLIFSIWSNKVIDEVICSSNDRNEVILLLADKIIVGYCREGGKIEKQIEGKDNIEILPIKQTSIKKYDRDLFNIQMSSHSGEIYFDIKKDAKEDYLKITQSKFQGSDEKRREKIFIGRSELIEFRDAINKAIDYWNLEIKEKSAKKACKTELAGNAYLPWEKEADDLLISLYNEGRSIKELAEIFEREIGGIRSRLKKLGMIK